jgi:hypothetical protein
MAQERARGLAVSKKVNDGALIACFVRPKRLLSHASSDKGTSHAAADAWDARGRRDTDSKDTS